MYSIIITIANAQVIIIKAAIQFPLLNSASEINFFTETEIIPLIKISAEER